MANMQLPNEVKQFVAREVCTSSGPPRPRATRLLYGAPPPPAPPSSASIVHPSLSFRIARPIFFRIVSFRLDPRPGIPQSSLRAVNDLLRRERERDDRGDNRAGMEKAGMRTPVLGRAAWPRKITESLIVSGLATLYAVCDT